MKPRITTDVKRKAVQLGKDLGSRKKAAKKMGISLSALNRWSNDPEFNPSKSNYSVVKTEPIPDVASLQKEVRCLRAILQEFGVEFRIQ